MENRFARMDNEVNRRSQSNQTFTCRCELQTPHYDVVRSTAVVAIVTSDKLVVSNCGDSRAVLCRKGVAIPLSYDHKVILKMKKFNFLSKYRILKMKKFKLKHLKFLKFKILLNFKFSHPNTL